MNRRDFLATTALTSAAVATGIASDAQDKNEAQTTKRDHKPRQKGRVRRYNNALSSATSRG